jgi:predicted Zn-dependent protease with MMP-like domain
MTAHEFDGMVEQAYAKIPGRFRRRMANIAFIVENEPSSEQLRAARVSAGSTLLGLYRGRPLTARSVSDGFVMPDQIVIFQGPHERLARDAAHLQKLVDETVWHEVAHYFGMDEARVRSAERRRRIVKRPRLERS